LTRTPEAIVTLDERITRATIAILEDELARLRRELPKPAKVAKKKKHTKQQSAAYRRLLSKRMKAYWKNKHANEKETTS
jgi:Tfp pilus assembly protein PilN